MRIQQNIATSKEVLFHYRVFSGDAIHLNPASRDRSARWVVCHRCAMTDRCQDVQGRARVFMALKCVRARSSRMTAGEIKWTYLKPLGACFPDQTRRRDGVNVASCASENASLSEIITLNLENEICDPFKVSPPPPSSQPISTLFLLKCC